MRMERSGIDAEALAEAVRLSGCATEKEAVDLALREYAARRRRAALECLEHYADLGSGWDYEGWRVRREAEKRPGA
ncbi:type II toxin-antitoxin system VapB family antitoxin [Nocardiopsis sp. CNT-189]|uniref:type II toxin-antitoxin system VapB family antitoxin n=1 Tax=Nocardiopsis oceanisediminis TaxID=2816862 RepID=UPI003B3135DE